MRFTRKEQVGQSWENKYDETLLAVGPRNGVVYKLMSKEIKEHRDEPKENIASRVAVSGLMTDKDCREAIIADKAVKRATIPEMVKNILVECFSFGDV